MARATRFLAPFFMLGLFCSSSFAADLAIVQFNADHVVFASTPSGMARLPLALGSISRKQVCGSLGYINATSGEYLIGAGTDGIIVQKLGMNRVSNVTLADRIGTFTMQGDTYVVTLGHQKLFITKLARRPSSVRMSDGLALVEMGSEHTLFAPGADTQHMAELSHRPNSVQLARDMMITTSTQGTFVFTVSTAGIQGARVSDRKPTSVVLRTSPQTGAQ